MTTSQLAPEILTSFLIHVPLCNTASIETLTIPIPRQILTSRRHVGTTSWTLLPQGEENTCQPSCARTTIVSFTDISIPCDICIVLTTLYSLLLDLPLEIQCMILRHLDDIHYLTLLLTCKDMKPIVNFAIKKPCTKQDCALGHWIVERGRRDVLTSLICSKCGKFRPKDDFGDKIMISGATKPQHRWCIGCNFKDHGAKIYYFRQEGFLLVLCFECKQPTPLHAYLDTTMRRSSYSISCVTCFMDRRRPSSWGKPVRQIRSW